MRIAMMTPLPPDEILRQKFWGLFRLMRGTLTWQLALGVPAVLCGAYPWWAYPGLVRKTKAKPKAKARPKARR